VRWLLVFVSLFLKAFLTIALVLVPLHGTKELAVKIGRFRVGQIERARVGHVALWVKVGVWVFGLVHAHRTADPGTWSRPASCA
jgi:hypothetical protein